MHWFQLPQNCCKSENLAPFRDVRTRSQLQPSFLLAPAQLLLMPTGFLMVKGSAKSLRWGVRQRPSEPGADTAPTTACAGSAQPHMQEEMPSLLRQCARLSQGHGIVILASSLVTNSAPEDAPAFHGVLQTGDFVLKGKGELCFLWCYTYW